MISSRTANETMPDPIMVAIIGGAAAIIGAIIGGLFARRKNSADAAASITEAASKLIEPLNRRIDQLDKQVQMQAKKIDRYGQRVMTLMRGIELLIRQIADLGDTPVWTPDCWDPDEDEHDKR